MHTNLQPPSPRWNELPLSDLSRAAIIKFQDGEHRLRRLQQLALYPQVAKSTEVRAHYIAPVKKWPEAALQLCGHPVVGDRRRRVMAGNQQGQTARELFDGIAYAPMPSGRCPRCVSAAIHLLIV